MKNSILKQFSIARNNLQRAYLSGLIPYPRVANDYISHEDLKFYEYPHKPLVEFDEFSSSLKKEEYTINKATLPLFFTQNNISTPATLYRNLEYIDIFFDDQMNLRGNMLDIEDLLVEAMDIFRHESSQFFLKEVAEGKILFYEAPDEMSDTELLSVVAKDGEVYKGFRQEIMPYSIPLSGEYDQNNEKIKNVPHEGSTGVKPLDNPAVVKNFVSPTRNYPEKITEKSIWVNSLQDALFLENIRLEHENTANRIKREEEKRNISLENLERSVF